MKRPKKPLRKAARRAKRSSYDPCDPTAIPASTGMEQHLAGISPDLRRAAEEVLARPASTESDEEWINRLVANLVEFTD